MSSSEQAILIAVGADRPGLVDEVTRVIFERGGNLADSRMVNLRGQFAIMVLIEGSSEAVKRIEADLPEVASQLKLHVEMRPAGRHAEAMSDALPYRLVATALDQPGLVHHLSHVLRSLNVNIESLETRLTPAPITGAPMFEMEMILSVPRQTPISELRRTLTATCDDLNIDYQLSAR